MRLTLWKLNIYFSLKKSNRCSVSLLNFETHNGTILAFEYYLLMLIFNFKLHAVYKLDEEQTNFTRETFGYWSSENGLVDLRETRILSRRRRNLRKKVLKSTLIVVNTNSSINHLDDLRYII